MRSQGEIEKAARLLYGDSCLSGGPSAGSGTEGSGTEGSRAIASSPGDEAHRLVSEARELMAEAESALSRLSDIRGRIMSIMGRGEYLVDSSTGEPMAEWLMGREVRKTDWDSVAREFGIKREDILRHTTVSRTQRRFEILRPGGIRDVHGERSDA